MLHPPAVSALVLAVAIHATASAAETNRDVRSFGAKGDGIADDTAAIQRAVDAGGGVKFPSGTYRLAKTVAIELDRTGFVSLAGDGTARIVMAGAGPAFKFTGTHGGSAAPSEFKPNVWQRQRAPMVDALEIIGAHPEADAIEATGTMQLTVSRVVVRDARHAVHLTVRNRNVLLTDCHFYHNRGVGVFLDAVNLHQINIIGSHISYNAGGGVVSRGGNVRNIHIGTCDIESNMETNAPPTANILLDSTGGSVGEVAITGCTVQHKNPSPDSANIRVLGRGFDAALERRTGTADTQEGNITISGNVFSDVQVNIHLKDARGVVITGNTFWQGYRHDLLVENSTAVVIGANSFDRNPRYNYGNTQQANNGIVIRDSRDCTLSGLHVSGVWRHPAAVVVERCDRMHISDCTILDSDNAGLILKDVTRSRVSGLLIRDDRKDAPPFRPLIVTGGKDNRIEP